MHQRFAMLHAQTWADEKFLALSDDARLLFVWSLSQPDASVCGLYTCTTREMAAAFQENPTHPLTQGQRVQLALRELAEAGMVQYDPEWQHLWVVNRVKYQATSSTRNYNPKAIRLMRTEVNNMPDCPLRRRPAGQVGGHVGDAQVTPASVLSGRADNMQPACIIRNIRKEL